MANFLDEISIYNAKASAAIADAVAKGDGMKANFMSSLKSTANDTSLTEAERLDALTALINVGGLLDIPLPPYFPLAITYANTQTYVGLHNSLDGLNVEPYLHLTQAEKTSYENKASISDITFANLSDSYTNNAGLAAAIAGKQAAFASGNGFIKISGTTISYDNSTYLTAVSGPAGGELSGTYPNPTVSNAAVIAKVLTGFNGSASTGTITQADSILTAIQKLNANVKNIIDNPSGVSSVALTNNAGSVFTTTTTPQTGAAAINISLNSQNSGRFLASPAATSGVPSFRALVDSDLPVSGATAGTYGDASNIPQLTVDSKGRITAIISVSAAAGGQVNTVTLSGPGIFNNFTNTGTANVALSFGLSTQSANTVWAGPSSGAAASPSFRALVSDDIPTLAIGKITNLQATLDTYLSDELSDGKIWVGNASNAATPVTISGDVTISNAGVTTIGAKKVQYSMIQDVTTKTLLGRYDTIDGPVQQITLDPLQFTFSNGGVIGLQNPVAPVITTKGDLLSYTTQQARLPVGSNNGDILLVNSATSFGLNWATMSGDATIGATGALTIASKAVTLGKMANLAANSIIGNNTGSSATPIPLGKTQLTAMVEQFTSTLSGAVPASGGGATNFLNADGDWVAVTGTGTVTDVSVVTANGFDGTGAVANPTTSPAITIKLNSISGILKGTGTGITQATAGTEYVAPGVITTSGLTIATSRLAGRTTSGTNAIEEISVNGTLSLGSQTLGLNLGNLNVWTALQTFNVGIKLSGSNSGYVEFTAPVDAGTQSYVLPAATPPSTGAARFLTSTNAGVLSWAIPTAAAVSSKLTIAASGGDSPGVQYDGSAAVTIDYSTVGAQQLNAKLTGIAALSYSSGTPFVRMTGANTFTLDTNTYLSGTATQYAVLVGGAGNSVSSITAGSTTGQLLQYNSGSNNPSWSSVVYPTSTTINRILYSTSNNTIGEIGSPSNNGFLQYITGTGYTWNTSVLTSLTLSTGIGGIVSNTGTATAPILSVSGTLGGLVYFDSATSWDSTGALDQGEIIVGGGSGAPSTINNGDSGTLLKSNGAGNSPSFTAASYPSSTTANRILFSSANNVVDQIAAPTTANKFLKWTGSAFSWEDAGGSGSGTVSSSTPGRVAYYTGATTVDGLAFAGAGKFLKTNITNDGLEWADAGSGSGTVSSGSQYQLAYYAGAGTTTTVSGLTSINASKALVSNANGLPVASSVTDTELGYVSGVTSPIQTQLNGKEPSFSILSLTKGGTNASLTAVAGAVVYSTSSALAVSAAGTSGQFLASGGTGAPSWVATTGTGNVVLQTQPTIYTPYLGDTATNGHVHFRKAAGSAPSGVNNYATMFFQENGGVKRMGIIWDNLLYQSEIAFSASQTRTYTLPDATGTFALIDANNDVSVPKAGSVAGGIALGSGTSGTITLQAPSGAITGAGTYTLPDAYPLADTNYYLTSNTSGLLTWNEITGGGDVTSVAPTSPSPLGTFAVFNSATGKEISTPAAASLTTGGRATFNSGVDVGVSGSTPGSVVFRNSANAFTVTLQASNSATASATYTWPVAGGSVGNVLTFQASGNLAWSAAGSGDMTLAGTQTVTGAKTFNPTTLIVAGSTGGVTLAAPAGSSGTVTFPNGTNTLAALGVAQTFSAAQTFSSTATFGGAVTMNAAGSLTTAQLTFSGSTNNWISFGTTGSAAPAIGTNRPAGEKIAVYASATASISDFAIGMVSASEMYIGSSGVASGSTNNTSVAMYNAARRVGEFTIAGLVLRQSILTNTGLTGEDSAMAQITINNGAATNYGQGNALSILRFYTSVSSAPNILNARANGTRIVLNPNTANGSVDYAIGVDTASYETWITGGATSATDGGMVSFWVGLGTAFKRTVWITQNALNITDGGNIVLQTTTGTKIGTATSQKLSFWNKTPIVQPTTAIAGAAFSQVNTTTAVSTASTFGGYTLQQIAAALINTGILA